MAYNLIPSNWDTLREILLNPFTAIDEVYSFFTFASGKNCSNYKGLEELNRKDSGVDLLDLFEFIRIQALQIEIGFPERCIPYLNEEPIKLSREQILILMSHMTLLTLKPNKRHVYWVNFENWLSDGRPCAQAYLHGLFSYFRYAQGALNDSHWKNEILAFERRRHPSNVFPLPDIPIKEPIVHLTGGIGDHSVNIVDFANEYIGFGISGTQEEIIFGSFLELCPCMIFCCDSIKEDEAIIAKNVLKYAKYSGYGFGLKFLSPNNPKQPYTVIAIDALDFSNDPLTSLQSQLNPKNLSRELIKLVTGFSCIENGIIDSGHWGCGAFGGNKYIKVILQLIAATVSNNILSFSCFGDEEFYNSFVKIIPRLLAIKLSNIWDVLLTISPDQKDFVSFDFIK